MNDPLATVDTTTHEGHPLVRLSGEVDMSNAESLGDEVRTYIGAATTAYLDLTPVGFFDSQGLRMLHRLSDAATRAGTTLVVIAPPAGIVGSILSLTGMAADLNVLSHLPS